MVDESEIIGSSEGFPRGDNNHDQSTYQRNNYVARPPTFSGYSTELCDILEDCINIQVNGVGMVSDRKSLTPAQKNIYKKYQSKRNLS